MSPNGATGAWMVLLTRLYCDATRDSVPSSPEATQTAPAPAATPVGVAFNEIVLTSTCFLESTRDRVLSSRLATHTASWPTATPSGREPTGTCPTTLFVCGSMMPTELGGTTTRAGE